MESLPSDYQHIELTRSEKLFIRNILSQDNYGFLLINVNPAMRENDNMHVLIVADGIVLFKFLETLDDGHMFELVMTSYIDIMVKPTIDIISRKLATNKALTDDFGNLRFPMTIVYVFPKLDRKEVLENITDDLVKSFAETQCLFKEEIGMLRNNYADFISGFLDAPNIKVAENRLLINDNSINSILQRIAPEYTTIRMAGVMDEATNAGVDDELLVVTEKDVAVKAYRLDQDQINIVNRISRGEQLILACAGSGKSVLLIAKCFKAAAMNPDKKFLITCYNRNLYSLYTWFIDRAGLRAKNVTCVTFHNLCKRLLVQNGFKIQNDKFDQWVEQAIYQLNQGNIKQRFYGIFIDEVQVFTTEWYKFCYNLLENKGSNEHIFVICGDKTQKIQNQQKHGRAPWNAGEGYPSYRGGGKSIRIEKNYRNCIEVNDYINRYVTYAKEYLEIVDKNASYDPDMFLRGKAVNHGVGVSVKKLVDRSNSGEAKAIVDSVIKIHDVDGIPYDEIAIIMNNASYSGRFPGWKNRTYGIVSHLREMLDNEDIPYCQMYSSNEEWASYYGASGGVKLAKFDSVLGLDFRAAIICGLITLGEYDGTKNIDWASFAEGEERNKAVDDTRNNIRRLYVACTRAKEVLHIILPDTDSIYMKILLNSNR